MSKLQVQLKTRKVGNTTSFEGTVAIPGLQATKIVRRADNSTSFQTRSALTSAAKSVAKSLGYQDVTLLEPEVKKTVVIE